MDKNGSISNTQKLDFLKQCLKGSALEMICFLQSADTNYQTAKNILLESYTNKRKILAKHIQELVFLSPLGLIELHLNKLHFQVENIRS